MIDCFPCDISICILYTSYPYDVYEYRLEDYLVTMGFSNIQVHKLVKNDFKTLKTLLDKSYDMYFNLCEGSTDSQFAGPEIAEFFTNSCATFVGPTIDCYDPTRLRMKQICLQCDIKTPAYAFVQQFQQNVKQLKNLSYPMIVKHYNSANSIGLTPRSKVTNETQLQEQLKLTIGKYNKALVEQFIQGKQVTCLVTETESEQPFAYQPVEFIFKRPGDDFKYESLKWSDYDQMEIANIENEELSKNIKNICVKFFKAIKMIGYARFDLRVNHSGEIYFLEINPVPSCFYKPEEAGSCDHILLRSKERHAGFILRLMKAAIKNSKNRQLI